MYIHVCARVCFMLVCMHVDMYTIYTYVCIYMYVRVYFVCICLHVYESYYAHRTVLYKHAVYNYNTYCLH